MGQGLRDSTDTALRPWHLVAWITSVLLGAASALALMPAVFRSTPTDTSRIGVLLEALRDPESGLELAVFGHSAIMSGIDAAQLRRELPGDSLAWNCASTGQSLVESFLLTQQLPESVRTAVYAIERSPGGVNSALLPQKYNTFYLFGFRPDAETLDTLGRLYGPGMQTLLTRSHLGQLFDARWAIRQLADTQLRILLRSDLALASAERDLLHPQRYTQPIADELLQRFLRSQQEVLTEKTPRVPEADGELARRLALLGAEHGRRTVFLLPPVHPGIRAVHAESLARAASEFRELLEPVGALVLDATDLLDASHFIDDLHPTNSGAEILTRFVAQRIAG